MYALVCEKEFSHIVWVKSNGNPNLKIHDIFITVDNRQNEDDEQTNILIQIEGAQEGEEGEGEDDGHGDQDEAGDLDLIARQQEEGEEDSGQGEDDDLETTGELC